MTLIKICDVKNIYEARTLGEYGVNFIGLHYVSANDKARAEDLKMIIRLCHQDFPTTKTVLVTKEKDVKTLIALIDEFDCDGLQLHYAVDTKTMARLRAHFGKQLLLFAVIVPGDESDEPALDYADYVIIDKSFVGGTGKSVTAAQRNQLIQQHAHRRLLLAGGITAESVTHQIDGIAGFDVQSAVKSNTPTSFENISLSNLQALLRALGKTVVHRRLGQVGFSATPEDVLTDYFGACDFWHFDFFDNVFGLRTDAEILLALIRQHSQLNSHFRFQIHIFSADSEYIAHAIEALGGVEVKSLEFYIHHNYQTVYSFALTNSLYASLDTKDIISGDFPLKKPLSKEKLVLCLQSEHHLDRSANANAAMKLIREFWGKQVDITLDRGILPGDLNYTLDQPVDVVSGRYLREHKKDGYNELRRSLKNVG